jgi:hypothetical protein
MAQSKGNEVLIFSSLSLDASLIPILQKKIISRSKCLLGSEGVEIVVQVLELLQHLVTVSSSSDSQL